MWLGTHQLKSRKLLTFSTVFFILDIVNLFEIREKAFFTRLFYRGIPLKSGNKPKLYGKSSDKTCKGYLSDLFRKGEAVGYQ